MTTTILPMALSPNSLKRTYHEADLQNPLSSSTLEDHVGVNHGGGSDQPVSEPSAENILPLQNDLLLGPEVPTDAGVMNSALPPADNANANPIETTPPKPATGSKRRKFTSEEQEARRLEKEAKDRQRAEEKVKLDDIKRVKEFEKEERRKEKEVQARLKEEERKKKEAQTSQREEERKMKEAQREEERRKKEEEKIKKDKAQLRLNSFFGQPAVAPERTTITAERGSHSPCGRGPNDTSLIDNDRTKSQSQSGSRISSKAQISEFERLFPPFFVQSHTNLAPQSQFSRDQDSLKYAQNRIDERLGSRLGTESDNSAPVFDPIRLFHLSPPGLLGACRRRRFSVREIVDSIHGTAHRPIDLTDAGPKIPLRNSTDLLKRFTVKYLKFAEDVRPPYIGTYSKICDPSEGSKLSRNPFTKTLPATNYDYDSEVEWEEPGEGEDLDSEGEEEAGEDEDEDEMEGFLDDEDGSEMVRAANLKLRSLNGDLEPFCTGLCWENASDQGVMNSIEGKITVDLSLLRLDILSDSFHLPIDPYSTLYWQPASTSNNHLHPSSSMDPLRLPLTMINRTNTLLPIPNSNSHVEDKPHANTPHNIISSSTLAPPPKPQPPKRLIAPELMTAFAAAVRGSDLTKAGLIEMLKKQFPKQTKDAIKDTLNLLAERVGAREADKRWVIKEGFGIGT